MIPGGIQGG